MVIKVKFKNIELHHVYQEQYKRLKSLKFSGSYKKDNYY